jgi:hypothetical protein
LWFGIRPRCARAPLAADAPATHSDASALLKLGLRAFALPLALFLLAVVALAYWRIGQGEDWVGIAALGVALLCGWRASRQSHTRQTK